MVKIYASMVLNHAYKELLSGKTKKEILFMPIKKLRVAKFWPSHPVVVYSRGVCQLIQDFSIRYQIDPHFRVLCPELVPTFL